MNINPIKQSGQLNNLTVATLLTCGVISLALTFSGRQTPLIEYCFRPNHQPHFCTQKKRYLMPEAQFAQMLSHPTSLEARIIAQKATRLRIINATNPHKWLWGIASTTFLCSAYLLSKGREHKLLEYLPHYRAQVQQSWLLGKLNNWQQLRQHSLEAVNTDRKRQYAADLDYQLWQFSTDRAARVKQLSMLSPEEIAIFQEQSRIRAQAQALSQLQQATGQPQSALPGQSLDQVNDPSDKLTAEKSVHQHQAISGATTDLFSEFRRIGQSIIKSMVVSDKSILLTSGTGTGKTTTQTYYLQQFLSRYPQAQIYALLNKNDQLYGVKRDRSFVFDPAALDQLPNDKEGRKALLEQVLTPLYTVYQIFLKRKQLPTSQRHQLQQTQPVRLILGDWYGTFQELLARLKPDELQSVLSMIRQIVTIGRDMGIALFCDTQSANLDSLGLANDASIRQSLDIFSQGFIFSQDGEHKGDLQTIRLVFSNKTICPPDDREDIVSAYNHLTHAINQGELKTPIIFTSVGSKPRLGIVPDLSPSPSTSTTLDWDSVIRNLDYQYQRSEFLVDASPQQPNNNAQSDSLQPPTLTPNLKLILAWAKGRGWLSANQVKQGVREFKDEPTITNDVIRDYFLSLKDKGYGETEGSDKALKWRILP